MRSGARLITWLACLCLAGASFGKPNGGYTPGGRGGSVNVVAASADDANSAKVKSKKKPKSHRGPAGKDMVPGDGTGVSTLNLKISYSAPLSGTTVGPVTATLKIMQWSARSSSYTDVTKTFLPNKMLTQLSVVSGNSTQVAIPSPQADVSGDFLLIVTVNDHDLVAIGTLPFYFEK